MEDNQIIIKDLSKVYNNGFNALKNVNLDIKKGEILAMLGPNGAGKTTLISIICGIVTPTSGKVTVDNFDIIDQYRETRSRIGLVPQELTLEQFETVFNNVSYSRGLYGKAPDPKHIEKVLKDLSLWDKKNLRLRQLSGGIPPDNCLNLKFFLSHKLKSFKTFSICFGSGAFPYNPLE